MNPQEKARVGLKRLIRAFFKNDYGEPFEATNGQADIFGLIFLRQFPRNQVIASTQYGKSDIVSMALIMRSIIYKENLAIISGTADKAMIIMSRVIQHSFDHEIFTSQLELDKGFPLDRLKRERSKDHITWLKGGGIRIFTANTNNKKKVKEALTGFGSPNIVEEEASLIPDDIHSMIMRMLGGHKDNFLLKLGNPFYRNHFHKSSTNSKYNRIVIDYKQALAEGRYSESFIDEMREQPFFSVLYGCQFPNEDDFLAGGYRKLIKDELLNKAFISEAEFNKKYTTNPEEAEEKGKVLLTRPRLGADFAGGGNDRSAYVIRWDRVMKLHSTNRIEDTMQQVPIIENVAKDFSILNQDIALDYGGLGQGVGDRLKELDYFINLIQFGQAAPEPAKYLNMRAYMYYQLLMWLEAGGKIVKDDGFYEFSVINYKQNSSSRLQIQPKEELKKQMKELGIDATSPDIADAAVLTFASNNELIDEDDIDMV